MQEVLVEITANASAFACEIIKIPLECICFQDPKGRRLI